jgi:hypothetical protein
MYYTHYALNFAYLSYTGDNEVETKDNQQIMEVRGSGAEEGGFVVYRQTVELVSMLEESIE